MEDVKIIAGEPAAPGVYRCNACANELKVTEDGKKLPLCSVCDSASWRVHCLQGKEDR